MLLFVDGFDHYNPTSQATLKGWSNNFNQWVTGRWPGSRGAYQRGGLDPDIGWTLPATATTLICGFAFSTANPSSGGIFSLRSSGVRVVSVGLSAATFPTRFTALKGALGSETNLGTGPTLLSSGTWYYVEVKMVINGATSTVEVRVNGVTEIGPVTTTLSGTVNEINKLSTGAWNIDDLYVCDGSGSYNNDFLGDVRVATLQPTSDSSAHLDFAATVPAPTFVSGSDVGTGTAGATFTVALPSYQAGDVIFLPVMTNNATDPTVPITATGWTKVATDTRVPGANSALRVLMRRMTDSDVTNGVSSVVLSAGGSAPASTSWSVHPTLYHFADGSLDIAVDIVTGTTVSSISSGTLTTTGPNRTILSFFGAPTNIRLTPTTVGVVERFDQNGAGTSLGYAGEELPAAAAGSYTVAGNLSGSASCVLASVVMKPAADHYAADNDNLAGPDGDTSYVADGTVGHIDLRGWSDIPAGSVVKAIQSVFYARKDDSATRQISTAIRQGGTDYVGSTLTVGGSYAFLRDVLERDPTSAAWTAANVNADEFGTKIIT